MKKNMYKNIWPGFSYGLGAFVVYCVAEKVIGGGDSHSEHHEGEGH